MTVLWPLTGRGRELEELREKIAVGQSAIVAGPAGIGLRRLAACGHSNKEVAAKLFVALRTVENHLHAVFGKLGITRRDELAELLR